MIERLVLLPLSRLRVVQRTHLLCTRTTKNTDFCSSFASEARVTPLDVSWTRFDCYYYSLAYLFDN